METCNTSKRRTSFSLPTLMLSFGAATGLFGPRAQAQAVEPPPQGTAIEQTIETDATAPRTYWKHPEYDAVMEVWESKEKGLRGRIVAINPADPKVREAVAKILKKSPKKTTHEDIMQFQGMEGDLTLHREGDKWTGSVYWSFKKKSYGLDVEEKKGKLHVRGFFLSFPLFGASVDLTPASKPVPAPTSVPAPKPPM